MAEGFITAALAAGGLYEYGDTAVHGILEDAHIELPEGSTYFGYVLKGDLVLTRDGRQTRVLYAGDYFSVVGPVQVVGNGGRAFVVAQKGYKGRELFGPLSGTGDFRYISGCTDSLLIPPNKKGDPCLNYLHVPPQIDQQPHTHPSIRVGIVIQGEGHCVVPEVPPAGLLQERIFIIQPEVVHSFHTDRGQTLEIVVFHPDSDVGMTDDNHPMLNRTEIGGVSANRLPHMRTR